MIKKIVTSFLITFIVVAMATKIVLINVPQETPVIPDGNVVVFCHAKVHCTMCNTLLSLVKEVLKKQESIDLKLVMLEYDSQTNQEFVEQFSVGTTAIILLEQKNGQTVRSSNITSDVWKCVGNESSFTEMLETKLSEFFK